jgi:hypothetical protein
VLHPLVDLTALEISAHFLPKINELHDLRSENQRRDKVHAKDGYFDNLEVADTSTYTMISGSRMHTGTRWRG